MSRSVPAATPVGDSDLVTHAAAGDERAVAELYDRYGQVLYAVAYRIVGQRADAEEVVLDAFAQAWREATRFDTSRGSVAGWLTTIARSRALDLVRARGAARGRPHFVAGDYIHVSQFRRCPPSPTGGGVHAEDHDRRQPA